MWFNGPRLTPNNECGFIANVVPLGKPLSIPCTPVRTGHVIYIQKKATGTLEICEVKVYGKKGMFIDFTFNTDFTYAESTIVMCMNT